MRIFARNKFLSFFGGILSIIVIVLAYNSVLKWSAEEAHSVSSNYSKCLGLKSMANESEVLEVMGQPDSIYVAEPGQQKGRRVLLYKNPSGMDDDNRIYVDTSTSRVLLVYCSNDRIK
jgi:hypothetical protein